MELKKLTLLLFIFGIFGCNKKQDKESFVENEKEKWKKELRLNGEIGPPCIENYNKWAEENPDEYFGLPKKVESKIYDFNNDGKDDILMYFHAGDPCNGGNGNASDYSQLVYSNGDDYLYDKNIMFRIEQKIINEFEKKVNNYSNSVAFIENFDKEISGTYIVWTNEDAHCCPSYTGNYRYDILNKKIVINIAKNIQ